MACAARAFLDGSRKLSCKFDSRLGEIFSYQGQRSDQEATQNSSSSSMTE